MAKNKFFTKKLVKVGRDEAVKRMIKATNIVENEAKRLVTVDTGNLRNSIDSQVDSKRDLVAGIVGAFNTPYAPFIEFGTGQFAENGQGRKTAWVYKSEDGKWHYTKGQKPQPFLRPALKNNISELKRIFTK
jgi:HK97 gp10 family phage protein